MGLLDVLNGMQNGPRGQRGPSSSGGGMSPITMAVLGVLAYKAVKSFSGQSSGNPAGAPSGNTSGGTPSHGGLGDLLGSLFAGGATGSVLSGGVGDLVKQFQQSGQGDVARSWVGTGPNKQISPNDLANALGADRINALMAQSGLSRDDLLTGLSRELPEAVDELTPDGRVPTEQELSRRI
jgi:uncharacterized protein YidB (DUF937 family)